MMKHVQLSPYRSRADTVSLSSTTSYGSLSPEPLGSRSSSYSSLNETSIQTTIKVYARCLRPDIEYKTLSITFQTTCKEVVGTLLGKYKMKHRDPKLFYLSMEVTVRKAGVRTHLALDEEARPAVLQSCHPKGDSKFSLQTRRGGLVKVHDSVLNSNSQYKSLLISARTTVDELIALLLNCYNSKERVEQFSLYEVNPEREQQRKLHPDDRPLQVQQTWLPSHECHFLVRKNPDYLPLSRRKIFWMSELPPLPTSRLFKSTSASNHNTAVTQLSKSSMSLVPWKKTPTTEETLQPEKYNQAKPKEKEPPIVKSFSTELKVFECNNNVKSKEKGNPGQSSYADYENYFYI
ncbi:uncharacterized protein LOC126745843 isoform X1 [Anthonomus grandis grandis]|nr:uncharacterized protein LOC126745843 isoform X1 [Anthonomus grandis grandis]XP_050309824.1 uncharacterized protein LOC126745843 isoform X1 [Anthonomus grandis grandis]